MSEKASVQGYDISKRSAAVIGCGGLGTNAAVHLAGAGIGKIILLDFDVVEERNLNRQFMYTPKDIGKEKCRLLAERLSAFSPDTEIIPVSKRITCKDDLKAADEAEIVIIAVDNVDARGIVAAYCESVGKPYVNGGVDGQFGTAYLCVPGVNPGLEEAGGLSGCPKKPLASSPIVGIIGAFEAKLALDFFLKNENHQGILYCLDDNKITALNLN